MSSSAVPDELRDDCTCVLLCTALEQPLISGPPSALHAWAASVCNMAQLQYSCCLLPTAGLDTSVQACCPGQVLR